MDPPSSLSGHAKPCWSLALPFCRIRDAHASWPAYLPRVLFCVLCPDVQDCSWRKIILHLKESRCNHVELMVQGPLPSKMQSPDKTSHSRGSSCMPKRA